MRLASNGVWTQGVTDMLLEVGIRLGVRVSVIASDISNPDSVKSIMTHFSKDRPLRGVIHAAGVTNSGVLSSMTPARCETVFAPKTYGAWLLHQCTENMDLDLFVVFSSISGILGMSGLANYAAASASPNGLAHYRRSLNLAATSVAYGTWAGDGGMASTLRETTKSGLTHFGLDPLTPEEGLLLLEQAIHSSRALTVAIAFDLGRLQKYMVEQGDIPPQLRSLLVQDISLVAKEKSINKVLSKRSRVSTPKLC